MGSSATPTGGNMRPLRAAELAGWGAGGTCRGSECPWRGRRSRPRARGRRAARARTRRDERRLSLPQRRAGASPRRAARAGRGRGRRGERGEGGVRGGERHAARSACERKARGRRAGRGRTGCARRDASSFRRERSAVDVDSVPLRRSSPTTAARGERLAGADERAGGSTRARVSREGRRPRRTARADAATRACAAECAGRRGAPQARPSSLATPGRVEIKISRWRVSVAHLGRVHRTF